jgi:exopolyphosphatase/guanosine-5'-triphosphate,3'-diphosphate pyrophosphatase
MSSPQPGSPQGQAAAAPDAGGAASSSYFAAVDLGSNSFHMLIARAIDHEVRVVDRLRDPVQLAMGLNAGGELAPEAQERALASLSRFGQRLREFPSAQVRAVGTNTLRQARRSREFLRRAEDALGHPIEVISGQEEARLIYLGVAHSAPADERRRLVVDIGGGSTECIIGEGFEPIQRASLFMGCIGWTRRFFPKGELTRDDMRRAEIAAGQELLAIERGFRSLGWETCFGSSGTIVAIEEILRASGWSKAGLTRMGVRKLRKRLVSFGRIDKIELPTLKPDRASVLPGGVAILTAIFRSLDIATMSASSGALREGLLYDMLGRVWHEDVRNRTIRQLAERYHVDHEQASRVERAAMRLYRQVAESWKLDDPEARALLLWAARLHEVGLDIAFSGYHKHGAYVVAHSDMPGFSLELQQVLATLIRTHRRKFTRALFSDLSPQWQLPAMRLSALLRLAVLLMRSRPARTVLVPKLSADKSTLTLECQSDWLAQEPLVAADLEQEIEAMRGAELQLRVLRQTEEKTKAPFRDADDRSAQGRSTS